MRCLRKEANEDPRDVVVGADMRDGGDVVEKVAVRKGEDGEGLSHGGDVGGCHNGTGGIQTHLLVCISVLR